MDILRSLDRSRSTRSCALYCAGAAAGNPLIEAGRIASKRSAPESRYSAITKYMLYILSPVLLRINPLIDGLTAGPRFPRLLMSARPPAAAPTDKYSLVSAKKSGVAEAIPMTATERARID